MSLDLSSYGTASGGPAQQRPEGITGAVETLSTGRPTRGKLDHTELTSLIDHCAFTFKACEGSLAPGGRPTPEWVIENVLDLRVEMFERFKFGGKRYRQSMKCGHITVFFDGITVEMGVHVEFSGQGCREYETGKQGNAEAVWDILLRRVLQFKGQFSRIDLAVDDKQGFLHLDQIRRYAKPVKGYEVYSNGELITPNRIRTKWRQWQPHMKMSLSTGLRLGDGVTFGDRKSECYLRIYNKALEQKEFGHWIRVELEIKNRKADEAVASILERGIGDTIAGVLRDNINFVSAHKGRAYSRWPVARWWNDFLGEVEAVKLNKKRPDKDMLQKRLWFEKQYSQFMAMIAHSFDWSLEEMTRWVEMLIKTGTSRMSAANWAKVSHHIKVRVNDERFKRKLKKKRNKFGFDVDNYLQVCPIPF
jgi:phage replication initiation protein